MHALEPVEQPDVPTDATGNGEPLIPVTAGPADVTALDAYRAAGWPRAVEQVTARAGVVAAIHTADAQLPDGFGLAVFEAW